MKNTIIAIFALSFMSVSHAAYKLYIPLEQPNGGSLPNGTIQIKPRSPGIPAESWRVTDPLYGEWINVGGIYGCSNWAPAPTSMLKDEPYNQTATDCKQDQSRTIQDREQETTTLEYRNVGLPVPANHTISVNSSRPSNGLASCLYNVDAINNYWYASAISNYLQVVVNGVAIKYQTNYTSTSITVNGVRYKRGALIKDNFYEVCK